MSSPNKADKTPLRVMAFGDSLTAGSTSWGARYHPYAPKMKEMLEGKLPNYDMQTLVNGAPGDVVISPPGRFYDRMKESYDGNQPFDWVVMLGGTNDLNWGYAPDSIIEALHRTWEIPLAAGSKVLAVTIPECANATDGLKLKRNQINRHIRGYERANFYVFDLCAAIPWDTMSDPDRMKYWDDGVHFTDAGYDLFGERAAERLVELMTQAKQAPIPSQPARSPPPRQPRRSRFRWVEDNRVWDEEGEEPRDITKGYIIVRKKDLD